MLILSALFFAACNDVPELNYENFNERFTEGLQGEWPCYIQLDLDSLELALNKPYEVQPNQLAPILQNVTVSGNRFGLSEYQLTNPGGNDERRMIIGEDTYDIQVSPSLNNFDLVKLRHLEDIGKSITLTRRDLN